MDTSCKIIFYKTDKKNRPKPTLRANNMSVVPPKFRNISALMTIRENTLTIPETACGQENGRTCGDLPISLPLITVGISVGTY